MEAAYTGTARHGTARHGTAGTAGTAGTVDLSPADGGGPEHAEDESVDGNAVVTSDYARLTSRAVK